MAAIATVQLAQGESSGYLAPPHGDRGLDTNSDRLYNYLQVDVRIEVTKSGRFALYAVLQDDLGAPLTDAMTTVSLAAGTAIVSVYLNGPDIYNGFLNGPYYAQITLKSEFGAVLSTGTHKTADYKYTDFQPYAIRFVSPASERGIDNDSDGLYDWLALALTLDVATEDDYAVASLLVDQGYVVAERWRTAAHLLPGRVTVTQFFLGYPLRIANVSGPYRVANELYDSRDVFVGSEGGFLLHTTAAYSPSQFEGPPVVLSPSHVDRGVDSDGDGLYSHLEVNVTLTAEKTSTVSLEGQLRSGDGIMLILAVKRTATVDKGVATVGLYFAGSTIYSKGVDGPFQVLLGVRDEKGRLLSEGVHTTRSYLHTQFEPRVLQLNPGQHVDYGIDIDGNAKYEILRLDVNVTVDLPGSFVFDATLWDGSMLIAIAEVSRLVSLVAGLPSVPIDFPGSLINASGINGPYRVTIRVRDARDGSLLDTGAHRTRGYFFSDFEVKTMTMDMTSNRREMMSYETATIGVTLTSGGKGVTGAIITPSSRLGGNFTATVELGGGRYEFRWDAPRVTIQTVARIDVRAKVGGYTDVAGFLTILVDPNKTDLVNPTQLFVLAQQSATSVTVGGTVTVTVYAYTIEGFVVSGANVTAILGRSPGSLSPVADLLDGVYRFTFTAPASVAGPTGVQITISVGKLGYAAGTARISITVLP